MRTRPRIRGRRWRQALALLVHLAVIPVIFPFWLLYRIGEFAERIGDPIGGLRSAAWRWAEWTDDPGDQ